MMVTGWMKNKLASPVRMRYFLSLKTGHTKLFFWPINIGNMQQNVYYAEARGKIYLNEVIGFLIKKYFTLLQ